MEQARMTAEALGLKWEAIEQVEEPAPANPPPGFEFVWQTFVELCAGRTAGMGPNPLQWSEIWSWSELVDVKLSHWELRCLKLLDVLWMKIVGSNNANSRTTDSGD